MREPARGAADLEPAPGRLRDLTVPIEHVKVAEERVVVGDDLEEPITEAEPDGITAPRLALRRLQRPLKRRVRPPEPDGG